MIDGISGIVLIVLIVLLAIGFKVLDKLFPPKD